MLYYTLVVLEVLIAMVIVGIILLQPHEGEGMGAVFGGSSSVDTFLGTKTITVLWKATIVLGVLFIGIAISLNLIDPPETGSQIEQRMEQKQTQQNNAENTRSDGENGSSGSAEETGEDGSE